MLLSYEGRRLELGMAEQFILMLADIPDFEILIEGHLMMAEYNKSMNRLKGSLNMMVDVSKLILENTHLKEFFHFLLNAGNFLNHVRLFPIVHVGVYMSLKFTHLRCYKVQFNI